MTEVTSHLSMKYFYFMLTTAVLQTASSTFLILHVIDLVGFKKLGVILAISFLTSAVTDFPTGVLADWLGHKWILTFAYVLYAISSFFLIFADGFNELLIAFLVLYLANGQASGALQSWFDNNYRKSAHDEDPNRENYREFLGKANMFFQYGSSLMFVIGGIIASIFSDGRLIVFGIQGVAYIFVAIAFALYLETSADKEEKKSEEGYFAILIGGVKFAFSTRLMSLYVLATVVYYAVGMVWVNLVLFPIYFGYTGSDFGAGALRWVIWFSGAYLAGRAGTLAKKLNEKDWMPRLNFLFFGSFFGITALTVTLIPFKNDANIAGIILILATFIFAGAMYSINVLLQQKFYLDVIPDDKRNSIYSLLPTLGFLIGSPMVFILGSQIESFGFEKAIFLFLVMAMVGVVLEFLALANYEPSGKFLSEQEAEDVIHPLLFDTYSIAGFESLSYTFPKTWQLSKSVQHMWDELMGAALQDGSISDDEKNILDKIMLNLKNYGNILENALEDGIIDEAEKLELLLARQKMIVEVEQIAIEDHDITEDEQNLIQKLIKISMDLDIDKIAKK